RFVCEIEPRDVDLDQPLLRQYSVEQKLQHLHVAGLSQLDGFADKFCLLVSNERLRDCRCSIFGPARATRIAGAEAALVVPSIRIRPYFTVALSHNCPPSALRLRLGLRGNRRYPWSRRLPAADAPGYNRRSRTARAENLRCGRGCL